MTPEQRKIAIILADARTDTHDHHISGGAVISMIARRIALMYFEEDPSFPMTEFFIKANQPGYTKGQ